MPLTRDQILARATGTTTETYQLADDPADTVVIRGLTRDEALKVRDADTLSDKDNTLISLGLVEPKMSAADVAAWAKTENAGVMAGLSERIGQLSGMSEGAGKSGVPRAGKRSRS